MWTRFLILMLVTLLNISLGFFVLKKSRANIAKMYFSFICFASAMWSLGWALASVIRKENIFLLDMRFLYIAATAIFLFFFLFAVNFLYKYKLARIVKYLIFLTSIAIVYIIVSGRLFEGIYEYQGFVYQLENNALILIYGIYFLLILLFSYYILLRKFLQSQGVNRKILSWLISWTAIAFILGIFFAWFMTCLGKQYFNWIGCLSTIFMNFSIFYLLFKKVEE